jgi:hypothetical protein
MATHVLVHKSGESLGSQAANPSAIVDGALALYNGDTAAVLSATYTTSGAIPFFYARGVVAGRNPRLSPIIKAGAVKSITKKNYAAPVQPIEVVGYTGSGSNSINFIAASGSSTVAYGIKIENLITLAPPFPKAYAQYTLRNGVTAYNNPVWVCDQLTKDLNQQLSVMPSIDGGQFAFVDVLSNLTSVQLVTSAPANITGTVTNGSNILTLSASAVGGTTAIAAGDWIRIGHATTATSPVYQIASVSTTTVTLTRPFVGTSASSVALGAILSANYPTTSSLAGIKISVTGSYFTANSYAAGKLNTMINVPLMDTLAGTPITVTQAMVYGSGTYNEVLKKEMQSLGDIGVENRIWMPLPNDTYADPAGTYIGYSIYYENSVADKSAQGQGRVEPGMLNIYVISGTTVTNFEAALAAVSGVAISA